MYGRVIDTCKKARKWRILRWMSTALSQRTNTCAFLFFCIK